MNINSLLLKCVGNRSVTLDDIKYYNLDIYQKLKYINDTQIKGNRQLETIGFVWNIRDENKIR